MKKLYEKNELGFSLMWIGIYLVLLSLADSLSNDVLHMYKSFTAPLCIVMSVFLTVWIVKNGLTEKYGLAGVKLEPAKYLFFIPLAAIVSVNLWYGVTMNVSPLESVLHVVSMICVGFLEEIIFRGFLFKALCRTGVKRAVIISAVTFGIGHIVNLFRGTQELLPTVLQICYAVAIGFLFTLIFLRSGSLLPCIITHSAVNSLSIFGAEQTDAQQMIAAVFLIVVCALYSVWILVKTKKIDN
ncbi:MAG: CPBP family intramembrane metalloprotease [Bacteroides sp.]|nr:CPBP family intramembrane metalloprotease [Bacteroides sp.]